MGAKQWYPNLGATGRSHECQFDLCEYCAGNVDLFVDGVRYDAKRCSCPCHPSKGVRRSDWPHTS